jgi:hypothetical protein
MAEGQLLYDCPLPGCKQPVADPRQPCPECLEAFGDMLTPSGRPTPPPDEYAALLEERDRRTNEIRYMQARIRRTAERHA